MKRAIFLLMISQLLLASPVAAWAGIMGFDNGVGWTTMSNGTGGPIINNGSLTLTDNGFGEARSAFYNTPQDYITGGGFTAQFDYQATGGGAPANPADGFAFVLQNDPRGASALGGNGNALGQGIQSSSPDIVPIHPSVAVLFNIFQNYTRGTELRPNGSVPSSYTPTGGVDLASGHDIRVTLFYNGVNTVVENLRDTVTNVQFNRVFNPNFDIPTTVGVPTAFVGFTGSTGASVSTQVISNFSFQNIPELDPGSLASALTLLGGGVLTVSGRRRRK